MNAKKLFIIDAMAMAFRSYHAMPQPLLTSKGLPTSAVYGSLTILMKIMEEERPDYVVVACDSREKTFRHELYEHYKANRTEFPQDLSLQMPAFFRMFETLGIPLIRVPGYEADDIVGTLVSQFASPELQCFIVSGDKDFMQLINENVFLFTPLAGGKFKLVDTAGVKERFGCRPDQVIDVLALTGDSSDNVPGVRGIGDKGASKLIEEFDSLENIYEHLDQVRNLRQREALQTHKKEAFLSKELVSIHKAMNLDFQLGEEAFDWKIAINSSPFMDFLEDQEFRSLIKRIKEKNPEEKKPEKKPARAFKLGEEPKKTLEELLQDYGKDYETRHYTLVNDHLKFHTLRKELSACQEFAFDTETTGLDSIEDKAIGISFGLGKGRAFYVPLLSKDLHGLEPLEIIQKLAPIFEDPKKLKIAHNLKFDLKMLRNTGIHPVGPFADTMLASFLLDSSGIHSMDSLSKKHLRLIKIPTTELMGPKYKTPMSEVDIQVLSYYACEDADCCLRLFHMLFPKLQKENLDSLFKDLEMPLVEILADMEQTGIYVNVDTLHTLSEQLALRSKELEAEIFAIAGEEFNLNSPKQLQNVIFEKMKIHEQLGVTKIKKTQSGLSTDVSVLESLSAHPLIQSLLEYRTVAKMKGTYTDTLPLMINARSKRIHTSFNQTGTATGRLSSNDPNLQNIPLHSEIGRKIRSAFEGQGDKVLVSADYSQIELRLLAHISEDKNLIEAFQKGLDIHKMTAAKILGKNIEDLTHDERNQAKAINYGVAYGMGPVRFAAETGLSLLKAREFIAKYFETFPRIRDQIEKSIAFATEHGFSKTLLGRKRIIEGLDHKSGLTLVNARNVAVNAPIQGTAADLIKLAMIQVTREIQARGLSAKMLLQIHDELVFECVPSELERLIPVIKESMEGAMTLSVPLVVEIGYGKNWLEAHN